MNLAKYLLILTIFPINLFCAEKKVESEKDFRFFPGSEFKDEQASFDPHYPTLLKNYLADSQDQKEQSSFAKASEDKEKKVEVEPVINQLLKEGTTFENFFNTCLYNQVFGFYINRVSLTGPKVSFVTEPIALSPNFGRQIAYLGYAMWRSMIESGDILATENFYFLEFGAGEGIWAFDIMEGIAYFANLEKAKESKATHWQEFQKVYLYIIGEKSPRLIEKQKAKNSKFLELKKLEILEADARDFNQKFGKKIKGLILSNELPDAFPVHKVKISKDKRAKVCVLLPIIHKLAFEFLEDSEQKLILEENKKLEILHKELLGREETALLYDLTLSNIVKTENYYFLSAQTWIRIKERIQKRDSRELIVKFNNHIHFIEYYIDNKYFADLQNYLNNHKKVLANIDSTNFDFSKTDGALYINRFVEDFVKSVSAILDRGFVLTIDYGESYRLHESQISSQLPPFENLRIYPKDYREIHKRELPLLRHIYQHCGEVDFTTDVNFTDLSLLGFANGLQTIHYNSESTLTDQNFAIAPGKSIIPFLRSAPFSQPLSEDGLDFMRTNWGHYKMLIQSRVSPGNRFRILTQSLRVFPKA